MNRNEYASWSCCSGVLGLLSRWWETSHYSSTLAYLLLIPSFPRPEISSFPQPFPPTTPSFPRPPLDLHSTLSIHHLLTPGIDRWTVEASTADDVSDKPIGSNTLLETS